MTVRVGSGIVKEGLIMHLDAADSINYLLSTVEVLVVAGGGGGGVCYGGGGGGGGVVYNSAYPVTPGTAINTSIGNGGTNQVNVSGNGGQGGNSSFGNLVATGGGYGGGNCGNVGGNGGSGGGGSGTGSARTAGGNGIAGQGTDGEFSIAPGGGGGGGAGFRGFRRSGGDGLPFSISGTVQYYSGGGSGGGSEDIPGGSGGGGMSGTAVAAGRANGRPNTGGGGGGSIISGGSGVSGIGGSGVIIVRYPGPQKASGGNTISYIGGYTIHTFTSGTSSFTPYSSVNSITGLHDLTGNQHHAVLGTQPTYNSANEGSFVFNGSTQYLRSVTNPKALQNLQGFSIFIWCKCTSSSPGRKYIFDGRGNKIVPEAAPGIGMGFDSGYSDNKIFHFVQAADNTYTEASSPTTFLNNQIYQLGMVRQPYSSTFQVVDTDSRTLITPNFTAPRMTASATVDIGEYVLGTFASSTAGAGQNYWWPGNIYCVLAYDRALTQDEVTQNFNALRGRFGL